MAAVGVVTFELQIEHARSLKDKRQVVKSLKDRLRARFNVAVAEIDYQDVWQRAAIAAVTVSSAKEKAEETLQRVEADAANVLGAMLVRADVEWL
jgi:uncharacterized protein YlxP (DUF503 family)